MPMRPNAIRWHTKDITSRLSLFLFDYVHWSLAPSAVCRRGSEGGAALMLPPIDRVVGQRVREAHPYDSLLNSSFFFPLPFLFWLKFIFMGTSIAWGCGLFFGVVFFFLHPCSSSTFFSASSRPLWAWKRAEDYTPRTLLLSYKRRSTVGTRKKRDFGDFQCKKWNKSKK